MLIPGVLVVTVICELLEINSKDSFDKFNDNEIFSPGFATPSPSPPF